MARSYYFSGNDSDLTGGVAFNKNASLLTESAGSLTVSVANSSTQTSYANTIAGEPGLSTFTTGNYSVKVNVTTASSSISLVVQLRRVSSTGATLETKTASASQSLGTTGVKTFSFSNLSWAAGSSTDRLQVIYTFTSSNSHGGAASVNIETGTTSTEILTPFPAVPPKFQSLGQYNSAWLPVSVGGTTDNGKSTTTPFYLVGDYEGSIPSNTVGFGFEKDPLGTSFANTSDQTLRTSRQVTSDFTYSGRGGSLEHDTLNDRYIFFGGYDGSVRYNTVWEHRMDIAGQPWRKLSPTGTAPTAKNLAASASVASSTTSFTIVWGGFGSSDTNELHVLNTTTPGSEVWYPITQTNAPSTRSYITRQMVAVPVTATTFDVYLFGGYAGASRANDLYKFTFNTASPSAAVTWTTLKANGAAGSPAGRSGGVLDYNPNDGNLYLYGGGTGSSNYTDFWRYTISSNTWTQISVSGTPPPSTELIAGGYDTVNNRFWYSGGWTGGSNTTGTNHIGYITNVTSGSGSAYTEVRANSTAEDSFPGFASAAVYLDKKRNYLIVYSGYYRDDFFRYESLIDLNDTATSDFPTYGLATGDYLKPRDAPSSIWNPTRGEWVITNGYSGMYDDASIVSGYHIGDIWTYNPTTNKWRYSVQGHKALPNQEGVATAYDSTRDRILAFGGLKGTNLNGNDVYALKADAYGNYKVTMLRPSGTKPPRRWLSAAAYDATNDRLIITFGGDSNGVVNTTYALNFSGSANGTWTQLSPTGTAPTFTIGPGYAQKTSANRLYIFGGATNTGLSTVSSQLVYLDYSTTNGAWVNPTSTGGTARRTPTMDYDSVNDQLIVFGGYDGSNVLQGLQYFSLSGTSFTSATPASSPVARRSAAGVFNPNNGKYYIFGGRPNTGTWYNDTWELTPNYGTPNSSTWANKNPDIYNPTAIRYTNLTDGNYHWQGWADESGTLSSYSSFGGNAESATDFTIGTIVYSAPTVTSSAATNVAGQSATANGNVTADGNSDITERGFVLALSSSADPTTATNIQKITVNGTTGAFSGNFTGLTGLTGYKYRPYATNAYGTSYGTAQTFTTTAAPPTVTTDQAQDGSTAIVVAGTVSNDGGATVTERGFVYATTQNPTTANTKVAYATSGTGSYSSRIASLSSNTTYYVRAYAINSSGTAYGDQIALTTTSVNKPPMVAQITPNATAFSTSSPTLQVQGQDPDLDGITYGIDIDTVSTFDSGLTTVTGNLTYNQAFILRAGSTIKIGQSIQPTSTVPLTRARFLLGRAGNPLGQFRATIYATTGTYGSTAVGTGTPLITSSTYYNTNDIPQTTSNPVWFDFWFDNSFTLQSGTTYAIVVELYGGITDSTTDYIAVFANANGFHDGNSMNMNNAGTWSAVNTSDIAFDVSTGTRYHYRQSNTNVGFLDTQDSTDTDPFTSGNIASYTVSSQTANTYYFDGSDGVTNSNNAWTNPANAYDGSLSTYASRNSATVGSASANYLHIQGTNAPTTGGAIDLVRVRVYHHAPAGPTQLYLQVSTDGLAQTLEEWPVRDWSGVGWSPYISLDIPTGGWTWQKVNDLEAKVWLQTTTAYEERVYRIEIDVLTSTSASLPDGTYYWRTVGYDSWGSLTFGPYSPTRTFSVLGKANYTKTHSTSAVKRKATTVSHTTNALKRLSPPISHSTSAVKRKQFTLAHSTDVFKRKASQLSHTTSANKRKAGLTVSHTTNANLKKSLSVFHTTDTFKQKSFTKSHTTSANKKVAGNLKTHTTDVLKRKTGSVSHSTDAYARTPKLTLTISHSTDALKRKQVTTTHTTDSVKRKAQSLSHTTSANKRKAFSVVHTTSANKKTAGLTRTHTTNAVLRRAITTAHTTNALKRVLGTLNHSTSTVLRKANTLSHTTSALKRKATAVSHTTNSNLKRAYSVSHTTSANKRLAGITRSHSTDANKRKALSLAHTTNALKRTANTLSHSTDTLKRIGSTKSHTTDSFLRKSATLSHDTDSFLRGASLVTHSTSANKRKAASVSHTTSSNKKRGYSVSHTTSANKKRSFTVFHSTNANRKKAGNLVSHSTNTLIRKANTLSHSTDALKRSSTAKTHTTDSLLRRTIQLVHSTNANKRKALVLSHSTNALKRTLNVKSHTTDTLKRRLLTLSHSTDSFLRRRISLNHTTDAFTRSASNVTHSTSANLRRAYSVSHSTSANKRKAGNLLSHTTSAVIRKANTLSHTTSTVKRAAKTLSHTTNSFIRKSWTASHTTNALLRRASALSHTTSANKRRAAVVSHTTNANKRKAFTLAHTTNALKRVSNLVVSHTTDSLLRKASTKAHTTDTNKRVSGFTKSHTTSAYIRSGFQLAHNTDANIRKSGLTVAHSTDTNKRKSGLLLSHTTNALLRKASTLAHSTSANKRRLAQIAHSTSAVIRKANVLSHSTNALKRTGNTVSHSTNALIRKVNALAHTTDSNLRKALTKAHLTDANKRRAAIVGHTTNANKRKATLVAHTTDVNRKKAGNIVSHSTSAVLRAVKSVAHTTSTVKRTANVLAHSTNAAIRKAGGLSHTTDSNLRKALTKFHTTSAFLRGADSLTHSTSANKRKAAIVSHSTSASKYSGTTKSHSTSSVLRRATSVSHTTNSNLRAVRTLTHSTSTYIRRALAVAHSTSANKRRADALSHSTSANLRKAGVLSHNTDSLLRRPLDVSHTTDSFLHTAVSVDHSTDTYLRKGRTVTHSTDVNKKSSASVAHTTDVSLAGQSGIGHTTDANLRTLRGKKWAFVDGEAVLASVMVLRDGVWVQATVFKLTDTGWEETY